MRTFLRSTAAALLILPGLFVAGAKERMMLSNTQTLSFDPRGVIQLEQSFGDVEIQGWDRAEVEITTIREGLGDLSESDLAEAEKDLDRVAITAVKHGEDRLKITTTLPGRKVSASLGAGSNPDVRYIIKAPAHAKLVVHHDIGHVNVTNFASDIEVTNRIGQIGLQLAQLDRYSVDARARIGGVVSDIGRNIDRSVMGQHIHRAQQFRNGHASRRQLYVRVGIGDISIQRVKW